MKKTLPLILPIFRIALFIIAGLLLVFITNQTLEQASRWWPILCSILNVITIIVLVLVCKYEGTSFFKLINYKKGQINVKNAILIILIMMIIGMGGMVAFSLLIYGYAPTFLIQPIPVWVAIINAIILPITVIFAELPLYFGYSFTRIEARTGNKYFAIGYSMFFYALQHSFIPLLFDWRYIVYRFLSFLPLLIVLGIIYNRNRNMAPLLIGHGVLDLATGVQILISSIWPAVFKMMQQGQ